MSDCCSTTCGCGREDSHKWEMWPARCFYSLVKIKKEQYRPQEETEGQDWEAEGHEVAEEEEEERSPPPRGPGKMVVEVVET